MPRIPKRLLALGGLAAGGIAFARKRRADRAGTPVPAAAPVAETPAPASSAPVAGTPAAGTPSPSTPAPATAATDDAAVLPGRGRTSIDDLVDAETAAAAAEAGAIGGPHLDDAHGDPALEPVYEAGGGESEGFEIAEDELIENASHGDGHAEPISDAFFPERESDEATAVDGEADEERVSEREPGDTDR
jgi:hypothetical protein